MTKQCSKCGEVKSLDEYYKNKDHKDGYQGSCKKCSDLYCCEWNKKNIDKKRIKAYNWFINNKNYYKIYYETNKEQIKSKGKEYRKNNKDKLEERNRTYRRKNKEKLKIYDYKRKKIKKTYNKIYRKNNIYKIFGIQYNKQTCIKEIKKHIGALIKLRDKNNISKELNYEKIK